MFSEKLAVDCSGGPLQILWSGETREAVPQVPLLEENEDDEDDDNSRGRQGMNQWREAQPEFAAPQDRLAHLYRYLDQGIPRRARCLRIRLWPLEFLAQALRHFGGTLECPGARGGPTQGWIFSRKVD